MGNKLNSQVSDAVKRQADGQTPIYQFINLKGGGELIEMMKLASKTKNYRLASCISQIMFCNLYLKTFHYKMLFEILSLHVYITVKNRSLD